MNKYSIRRMPIREKLYVTLQWALTLKSIILRKPYLDLPDILSWPSSDDSAKTFIDQYRFLSEARRLWHLSRIALALTAIFSALLLSSLVAAGPLVHELILAYVPPNFYFDNKLAFIGITDVIQAALWGGWLLVAIFLASIIHKANLSRRKYRNDSLLLSHYYKTICDLKEFRRTKKQGDATHEYGFQ